MHSAPRAAYSPLSVARPVTPATQTEIKLGLAYELRVKISTTRSMIQDNLMAEFSTRASCLGATPVPDDI